jgi:hypothetical protein
MIHPIDCFNAVIRNYDESTARQTGKIHSCAMSVKDQILASLEYFVKVEVLTYLTKTEWQAVSFASSVHDGTNG